MRSASDLDDSVGRTPRKALAAGRNVISILQSEIDFRIKAPHVSHESASEFTAALSPNLVDVDPAKKRWANRNRLVILPKQVPDSRFRVRDLLS